MIASAERPVFDFFFAFFLSKSHSTCIIRLSLGLSIPPCQQKRGCFFFGNLSEKIATSLSHGDIITAHCGNMRSPVLLNSEHAIAHQYDNRGQAAMTAGPWLNRPSSAVPPSSFPRRTLFPSLLRHGCVLCASLDGTHPLLLPLHHRALNQCLLSP